ncbi:uncharacterized protein [Amphiura filiformis]|uniref:uncharacterized protein n=1 Tax=Amphiura filiformis TaxID=82378 RepID=UPI003B22156C
MSTVVTTVLAYGSCFILLTIGFEHPAQYQNCNGTVCTYVESAEYANCKSRNLVQIPPHCSSAIYLDMRKNDVRFLDGTSLVGFVKLKYLYLDGNQIRNITPGAFAHCTMVQQIFLQNNQIRIVQSGVFMELRDLRHLYLNSAEVHTIQEGAFDDLSALERLYLSDNALSTIPHNLFHDLSNLQILTLANNHLRSLARDAFQGLFNLEYLDVKFNSLTSIPNGLFNGLSNMRRLILSFNRVNIIEEGAINWEELTQFETLDMRNNSLSDVKNISSSESPPMHVKYHFAGNPILCDCHAKWLFEWYEFNNNSSIVDDSGAMVICQGPSPLTGLPMRTISKNWLGCKTKEKHLPNTSKPRATPKKILTERPLFSGRITDEVVPATPLSVDKITDEEVAPAKSIIGGELADTNDTVRNKTYSYLDQNKIAKSDEIILPYVGIGLLVACAIIVATCFIYFCWDRGTDSDAQTQENQHKPKPPINPDVHVTMNPHVHPYGDDEEEDEGVEVGEDDTYEKVSPSLQPSSQQRSLPTPPQERADNPLHQQPCLQPNSGYITTMELPIHCQRPPFTHSTSTPVATSVTDNTRTSSLSQPVNIAAPATPNRHNPFDDPLPFHTCHHQLISPGMNQNPNMQDLILDLNNNSQPTPFHHIPEQFIHNHITCQNGMSRHQSPIQDYSKCAFGQKTTCTNPFCPQQPLLLQQPQHDPT